MSRFNIHDEIDDFDDYGPSKTEQKKAMERLQTLGERLAELNSNRLKKMPISETLYEALEELKRLKAHEAVRRHKQYIGKLMRDENEEAILNALNPLANPTINRQMALLVERLMTQGDPAINDTVRQYPAADRHTLRQHVRSALKEAALIADMKEEAKATAETPARQKLQTYLHQIVAIS